MSEKIAVIGLGYVGLPLAVALGREFDIVGFDINQARVESLNKNEDWTGEVSGADLKAANVKYTTDEKELDGCTFFIVTVPTPVTDAKVPDLGFVRSAAETVGRHISKGDVVVLESTVFPGATESVLGTTVEGVSGLKCGVDFKLGYSPERINPGDKEHTLEKIIKVVSGQDEEALKRVSAVYGKVCKAGVFEAADIRVAEAAKVIENIQRDLNIALMNELSVIFHKLDIQTKDVLEAANTKWNFLNFHPGLVGGHCIGVDPYYLTYKAQEIGYHPEIILAGRKLNDGMPKFVVGLLAEKLNMVEKPLAGSKVLVLGVTFKANVKDCRNSKVADLIGELRRKDAEVMAVDPLIIDEPEEAKKECKVELTKMADVGRVDAVILAVGHNEFKSVTLEKLKGLMPDKPVLVDLYNFYDVDEAKKQGFVIDAL